LTAAKFKPLVFPVSGFALSNIANIFILMILNDFCLASKQAKKYTLGTDPKENTTSERTPKKIPPHYCRYQETDRY
jgi:hypothetical protein